MALRPPRAGFSVARRMSERACAEQPAPAPGAMAGLGGLVESLRDMMEKLVETARAGQPGQGGGETGVAGGKGRMVFGYSLRMGEDGISAEPFGDIPTGRRPAPEVAAQPEARQPIVEITEEAGWLVVVAELPGADPDTIACEAAGRSLVITAGGARRYRKELALPAPVRADGPAHSFCNGILEIRLQLAGPA